MDVWTYRSSISRWNPNVPTMKYNILARCPDDLTAGWAQRVVNNHCLGTTVSRTNIISVDTGTTTRICLAIEHNGPETLPRRWFVKLPSLAWRARLITALPRLLHTEVRFYKEAARNVPVAIPDFLAAQSAPGKGAILVLRDVTGSDSSLKASEAHPQASARLLQITLHLRLIRLFASSNHKVLLQAR